MTARRQWRVAVLPGDGIGPEVMAVTVNALRALAESGGPVLDLVELPWPSTAWHREHGEMMPQDGLDQLAAFDVLLLGALGDPGPANDPQRYVLPDAVSLAPLLEIRKGFDQWACERPAILLDGAPQYLADPRARQIDMLVLRENSEGEYVGQGGRLAAGTSREIVTQVEVFTRHAAERLFHHAFARARQRAAEREQGRRGDRRFPLPGGGEARARVCLITKRNALRHWGEMYTEVFAEVAADYPDVATHHELVDAACMKFVTAPWQFDVVAASNLQGDILTDLAAVLAGGMGIAPSSNIKPDDRRSPPMFEPTHGSAPDIAGKGLAGPAAMLLTAAMMLDWMGEEDPAAAEAGRRLRAAVEADLVASGDTRRSTAQVGEAVLARL
ncbi:isocitrate/isopropylmalate dehydrogenase family protein [Alkalilimnicola sp. S0819]|uniref:isocitrate/isopropylmalate dehydrogenase family protein n=1 Tax=Alkalilimnicola sp. S0819 TaxID=2613922 RepID=UPI0012629B5B|nr:isocitrate/isopropylmalate family dehydrogenase [Alkalilimnicola sp. S0819]KAB7619656.1 isocitrate/isopropylmalate dehydrogenase family protein [Alkalilimnicola sp. S0819]MPQ17594.1 isocitrate/isopropylmalate dehydrogenase family protein [Alkalilimnicola sp. S0819]